MKKLLSIGLAIGIVLTIIVKDAQAIPAFSRKYKTSCSTCHYAFPMLNAFGKAFKNNGYRYPGGDENYIKEEPVSLGAEAYKRVWPDAIWPADIAGTVPIAAHLIGRIGYLPNASVKTSLELPHELELLYAGSIGENFSFFGEVEIENEDNSTEFAFPMFLQYDFDPRWHIRAGMVGAELTPNHLRLTKNHYNIASFKSQNGWRLRDDEFGIEFWGAGNGPGGNGGYTFRLGLVNGQGVLTDLNSGKDFYVRATYKFGGLGELGGAEQVIEKPEFYIDNSVTVGGFFYKGTATANTVDEDFTAFGGDVDVWFNRLIVNGAVMLMNSDLPGKDTRKSLVYYAQANYVIFPWLIGLFRYEWEDKDTDLETVKPVNSIIPALSFVLRANVKFTLEYKKPLDEANKNNDAFVLQINFGI